MNSTAANAAVSDEQWAELMATNERLIEQVSAQQEQIDELRRRLDVLQATNYEQQVAITELRTAPAEPQAPALAQGGPFRWGGEVAAAFFSGGADSNWPNDEFRVDEAKLFLEAGISRGVYVFSELDLMIRESNDDSFHLGEAYIEFDNVSRFWGQDNALTLRAGRVDIPFGEEYQHRSPVDNPLISRSLADIWGIDEGIQAFGRVGPAQYALSIQNGSHTALHDWDSDKALTGRLSFEPAPNWSVSGSVMRTGDIQASSGNFSEVWFGRAFFRSIGDPATTTVFSTDLAQLDLAYRWRDGHAKLAVGQAGYDDDDASADNRRTLRYMSLETRIDLFESWFAAARFSRIYTDQGYPIVGNGPFGRFFFGVPTRDVSRWGLGLGFRPEPTMVFKLEYTLEDGELITGASRGNQNQFSAQAGVRF